MYEETRANNTETDRLRTTTEILIESNKTINNLLSLPSPEYPRYQEENTEQNKEDEESVFLRYFNAVERIIAERNREVNFVALENLRKNGKFRKILQSAGLQGSITNDVLILNDSQKREYVRIQTIPGNTLVYSINTVLQKTFDISGTGDALITDLEAIISGVEEHYQIYNQKTLELHSIPNVPEILEIIKERELEVIKSAEAEMPSHISFHKQGYEVLRITLNTDYTYQVADEHYKAIQLLREEVLPDLLRTEITTPSEERLQHNLQEIHAVFEDPGFITFLKQHNLVLNKTPREDREHIFFDLLNAEGQITASFALQLITGDIWIMDKDGSPISSLDALMRNNIIDNMNSSQRLQSDNLIQQHNKLPITLYKDSNDNITILLIGSHENMADAIILAHFMTKKQQITFFSIPRDLYYRGRKINSIYARFGPERLVREIEEIINLDIDHYIAIDMFAFIDAVNAIGGIDVVIEEDLIDPGYKIKDKGKWSTLYYPAGSHHLSGIAALRVARSRGTTSDFRRSERQQNILKAFYEKLQNIGINDGEAMFALVKILFSYVRSDINIVNMLMYLRRFANVTVGRQVVLDTSNVFYSTYTNLRFLKEGDPEPDNKGLWILLPLDNNWKLIPRFVHSNIQAQQNS